MVDVKYNRWKSSDKVTMEAVRAEMVTRRKKDTEKTVNLLLTKLSKKQNEFAKGEGSKLSMSKDI